MHTDFSPSSSLIKIFQEKRQRLYNRFKSTDDPYAFFQAYCALVDRTVHILWERAFVNSTGSFALLAIGGFGRREVYPHSDIDLALISAKPFTEGDKEGISYFVNALWDMGLHPALTAGTVDELFTACKEEITKETAFLETHFITGDIHLSDQLLHKLDNKRDLAYFIGAKINEFLTRTHHFKGAIKQLEPDVKNAPGGLRDIHVLIWLAKVQNPAVAPIILLKDQIVNKEEAAQLLLSHKNLACLRIHLHMLTHKNENHLFFDYQPLIAPLIPGLNIKDAAHNSEQVMQLFYRATKSVRQLMAIFIPLLKRRVWCDYPRKVFRIDRNYYQENQLIASYSPTLFHQEPSELLNIFTYIQDNPSLSGMAPETLRAWWQAVQKMDINFAHNTRNQDLFISLFKKGEALFTIIQFLNLYGFLEKYLPDFAHITGLLQNDLFHIYPVDEHILTVIYYLNRLEDPNFTYEAPLASSLMRQFNSKYMLYLAALFHDIGKGHGGGHEVIGAQIVRQFCEMHRLPKEDTETISYLVLHHLDLSMTAQRKDIGHQEVIKAFADRVETPERLVALYLLTLSDVRGTNPKLWTNWKRNLFYQLFTATLNVLQKKSTLSEIHSLEPKQTSIQELIRQDKRYQPWLHAFAQRIDPTFFIHQTFDDIQWQVKALFENKHQALFDLRFLDENTLTMFIYTPHQVGLMLILSRIFASLHLSILQVKMFTEKGGWLLHKFIVSFPEGCQGDDLNRITTALKEKLNHLIDGTLDSEGVSIPAIPLARRVLHSTIIPKVIIDEESYETGDVSIGERGGNFYLISIVAINRNDLLANLLEILNRYPLNIYSATVNTSGQRAEDSFIVEGAFLSSLKNRLQLKNDLLPICSI